MPGRSPAIEQVLTMLEEAPPRIAALTAGLPPDQLLAAPHSGEWSANEVQAHLRACADVWGGCIVEMINRDNPTLRAVNPRTWIKRTDYLERQFRPSLRAHAQQLAALLAIPRSLPPPDGWLRMATVTGAGRPLERTVMLYALWLARHERPHLNQIERIVAAIQAKD